MDDTDSDSDLTEARQSDDPMKPWLYEWNTYLQTHEIVPEGTGLVRWWGVSDICIVLCFILM